jgi:5-methylcytosine-specific restriction endonuclease McrA
MKLHAIVRKPRSRKPAPERPTRTCVQCSVPIEGNLKSCSAECREARAKRRYLDRKGLASLADRAVPCLRCGVEVRGTRVRVCPDCRELAERQVIRRGRRRRKARQRGVTSEAYTLAYIAERDGFRCKLCNKPVAMKQVVPHPKAPTIDHILPLALGGEDTKANVQLAHFICNSTKGANASPRGDQLALVG